VLAQAIRELRSALPVESREIIVPFPPGGSADASARIVAEKTGENGSSRCSSRTSPARHDDRGGLCRERGA